MKAGRQRYMQSSRTIGASGVEYLLIVFYTAKIKGNVNPVVERTGRYICILR